MLNDLLTEVNIKYLLIGFIIIIVIIYLKRSENLTLNVSTDGKCGPNNNNTMCPSGKCCSTSGLCQDCNTLENGFNGFYNGIPNNYIKCGDEGNYCMHFGDDDIYYGVKDERIARIPSGEINAGNFSCLSMNHEQYRMPNAPLLNFPVLPVYDPAPGKNKACYIIEKNKNYEKI